MSTDLSGANEVNAAGTPGAGDPDGTGTAALTLNSGIGEICFDITVANINNNLTGAHIHRAPAGSNGPIVVGFLNGPGTGPNLSGCVSVDRALVKEIRQNPEGFYVNVHNVDFRPGAVRGQLSK